MDTIPVRLQECYFGWHAKVGGLGLIKYVIGLPEWLVTLTFQEAVLGPL